MNPIPDTLENDIECEIGQSHEAGLFLVGKWHRENTPYAIAITITNFKLFVLQVALDRIRCAYREQQLRKPLNEES